MADAISKINKSCTFLSAIGDDPHGKFLQTLMPHECKTNYIIDQKNSTANCAVIFDKYGDFKLMVGDMDIHASISVDFINKNIELIKNSPVTIIDANLEVSTMEHILEICKKYKRPGMFHIILDLIKNEIT